MSLKLSHFVHYYKVVDKYKFICFITDFTLSSSAKKADHVYMASLNVQSSLMGKMVNLPP